MPKVCVDVYVLRHGKAEERSLTVKGDSKRELTEAGKKELQCIAKAIKRLDVKFDCIASSPLLRAKQTAEIALSHVKSKKRSIVIWSELKPESEVKEILKKLSALKPDYSVLIVGHEPVLSELISSMISPMNRGISISLRKGGFAHVECSVRASAVIGTLRSILTPKQLKRICK